MGDGRAREGRGLHRALLRSGWSNDHDAEDEDDDVALQVSHRAGERCLALYTGGLLLHQLPHVDVRSLVALQLPEQSREVQGRRREERVQSQGVLLVLHDFSDSSGRRRGAEKFIRQIGGGYMVALRIHHHRILHSESGGFPHSVQTGNTH